MLLRFYYSIYRLLCPHLFPYQTLTYYIPAPPKRTSGYREKEFDRLLYSFLKMGHELISIKPQSHCTDGASGLWVIVTVRASKPQRELNLSCDFSTDNQENGEIDGLYYIQD